MFKHIINIISFVIELINLTNDYNGTTTRYEYDVRQNTTAAQIIYYNGFVCEFKRLYICVCLSCKVNPLALGQCRIPRQHCEAVVVLISSRFACWVQMKWNIHTCGHIYMYILWSPIRDEIDETMMSKTTPMVCLHLVYTYIYIYMEVDVAWKREYGSVVIKYVARYCHD